MTTLSNKFGIFDLEIERQPNRDPLKVLDQLEDALALAITEWQTLILEYRAIRGLVHLSNNDLQELHNAEIKNGFFNFNAIIKDLQNQMEDIIKRRYKNIERSVATAQYTAMQLLLHIIKLREQKPQRSSTKLLNIAKLQEGKQRAKTERIKANSLYPKTIAGAVDFINDNYINWYKAWYSYKNNPEQNKAKYSQIPRHFKNWFCRIDKSTPAAKNKNANLYWTKNKKTSANPFICNFLKNN